MKLSIRTAFAPVVAALFFACAVAPAHTGAGCRPRGALGRRRRAAAPRGPVAARRRPHQRAGARLPAAGQQVGRQPDRLPCGARDQGHRREGRDLRRDLRDRPHAGRQGRAHGRVREHERSARSISRRCRIAARPTCRSCRRNSARKIRTIALDRLQSSLAIAGVKPPTVEVQNNPPQVLVSYSPAILVPIDGAPVMKPVPSDSRYQARHQHARADPAGRVRQTTSIIHVYDGWLSRRRSTGPWTQPFLPSERRATSMAQISPRRASSTCSTAAPRPIPSPRSPTAFPRSTRARSRRN